MPSIAETITWSVDLSTHPAVPRRSWSALDASVEVVITQVRGDETHRYSLSDDELSHGRNQTLELALTPWTLSEAGAYRVQARVDVDGRTAVVPTDPDVIHVADSIL